ncbi:hypothetical protein EJ03DRAFT_131846 [Teratosphaeria nubilosa]|uniref:Uncharacterized protein n=1 Tax=Teratosphaeria nubilosa TaxID=161662 RepID=A0A6G1LKN4_9PEZI|nr:hypothetical protein EJ03DRAFT_131846 [Teratosphaeria nubilosa]
MRSSQWKTASVCMLRAEVAPHTLSHAALHLLAQCGRLSRCSAVSLVAMPFKATASRHKRHCNAARLSHPTRLHGSASRACWSLAHRPRMMRSASLLSADRQLPAFPHTNRSALARERAADGIEQLYA